MTENDENGNFTDVLPYITYNRGVSTDLTNHEKQSYCDSLTQDSLLLVISY